MLIKFLYIITVFKKFAFDNKSDNHKIFHDFRILLEFECLLPDGKQFRMRNINVFLSSGARQILPVATRDEGRGRLKLLDKVICVLMQLIVCGSVSMSKDKGVQSQETSSSRRREISSQKKKINFRVKNEKKMTIFCVGELEPCGVIPLRG